MTEICMALLELLRNTACLVHPFLWLRAPTFHPPASGQLRGRYSPFGIYLPLQFAFHTFLMKGTICAFPFVGRAPP